MRQKINLGIQLMDSVSPILNLVPVPGLLAAWKGFKGLWDLVQQVHEGRSQLEVLSGSVAEFLGVLDKKLKGNATFAASVKPELENLRSLIEEISEFARKQADKPFLKRLLQGDEITGAVTDYHQRLLDKYAVFHLSSELDSKRWQSEFESAHRRDQETLERKLDELMKNQDRFFVELFGKMDVQQTQLLAALSAILNCIERSEANEDHNPIERHFLQHSASLLQRRSGRVIKTETWMVSSFEIDKGEKLDSGGFSTVYKATFFGAPVAVKELTSTTSSEMLMNEIKIWKRIRHPNILQFMGASIFDNPPFIIMEFMSNGNAIDFIRKKPAANRVKIVYEVSCGLAFLHSRSTIHGDLKATNVLIKADGTAVITDFGLSRIKFKLDVSSKSTNALVYGTRRWMSPERMRGEQLSPPVDVYAWAMTAYEVFTGLVPFGSSHESRLEDLVLKENKRPERPEESTAIQVGLTDVVWSLIQRSWAAEPERRPNAGKIENEMLQIIRVMRQKQPKPSDPVVDKPPSSSVKDLPSLPPVVKESMKTSTRKSLAAVTLLTVRVYVQDAEGYIQELKCDGSPRQVIDKVFGKHSYVPIWQKRPSFEYSSTTTKWQSSPGSGISATGLTENGGNGREVIRLCAQDKSDVLKAWELRANRDIYSGEMNMEPSKCKVGGSVATIQIGSGDKYSVLGIFSQGVDGKIYSRWLRRGRWGPLRPVIPEALPLPTAIAAVHTEDFEVRLYMQGKNSKIVEGISRITYVPPDHSFSSPDNSLIYYVPEARVGFIFPTQAAPRTPIAAIAWKPTQICLFFLDKTTHIAQWFHTIGGGWQDTGVRWPASPSTGIATSITMVKKVTYIWLYFHGPDGLLQRVIGSETKGGPRWTVPQSIPINGQNYSSAQ